ncbi:MAG: hypothetical protein DCF17_01225 [Shackletoniella antarctica]|uniref:TIGR04255 family protein n=1 Tax=Shackletoniella antarctica TaxID=268115 RepID=A0A2W4WK30_9CYAN|nr:MAG: hypothetical protein DCF17_01225 [Shackletoniella antarctica]
MTSDKTKILKFESPPIVEKLMGVQFAPLQAWSIPHFGLFWNEIRSNFPRFTVQPSLLRGESEIAIEDSIRCWFFHESQSKLIQIQRDRFLYNWQKPTTYAEYPHYENIKPEFLEYWNIFCQFLAKNQIEQPSIEQCEITYIDHFEKDKEWKSLSDLPSVINCWSGLSGDILHEEPDFINIKLAYSLPEINGTLTISLQPAVRSEDSKEIFQLTIAVTGKPASQSIDDLISWFDSGRELAIRSFVDFTTEEMHDFWRKSK